MQRRNCAFLIGILLMGVGACSNHLAGIHMKTDALYTARSFLVGNQVESRGYGLYSYLLFPAPPRPDNRQRYEEAIRAYLGHDPAPAMEALLPREQLNIFYLMLSKKPSGQVARCLEENCYPVGDDTVEWILSQYNYARATVMLRRTLSMEPEGPCIVTVHQPPALKSAAVPGSHSVVEALLQDLSSSPPHLVNAWVHLFIKNATGQGSAFDNNLLALQLKVYSALENYAAGLSETMRPTKACFMIFQK